MGAWPKIEDAIVEFPCFQELEPVAKPVLAPGGRDSGFELHSIRTPAHSIDVNDNIQIVLTSPKTFSCVFGLLGTAWEHRDVYC